MTQQESEELPWPENPREAMTRLVDEQGGLLYSLGLRFCGDAGEAEDLVQETFIQAFRNWGSFEHRSKVSTWLYSIAARVCQRMHRKRAGEPENIGSLQELLPFGEPLIAQIASDLEEEVVSQIRKESLEEMEARIAELPLEFRMPLVLKDIVGLSVPEISEATGMQEGTVKSRVHRARLKLRLLIDGKLPRTDESPPPAAYPIQVCLDLLDAKQTSLDRNTEFRSEVICQRCQSVFASLDLTQDVCGELARGKIPEGLRGRLEEAMDEL
jgi:RNA polymerase sigma-70 factor (ECF subfamily)